MTTYNRQSSFENGDVIDAGLLNNEYDAIALALSKGTGHKHDGNELGFIDTVANSTGVTKVSIDSTDSENHKINYYLDNSIVWTINANDPLNLLQTDKITHLGQELQEFLTENITNAQEYAERAEAAAMSIGIPANVLDGDTFTISEDAEVVDVVFEGDGTLVLPLAIVEGRRFTARVSIKAAEGKIVSIPNPTYTIIGNQMTLSPGDGLEIYPGDLVILEALSTTELEIL